MTSADSSSAAAASSSLGNVEAEPKAPSTESQFAFAAHSALERAGQRAEADAEQRRSRRSAGAVDEPSDDDDEGGIEGPSSVYLVGCGPGDPELLTLKAFRLISSASLVLYDRLVSAEVLSCCSPDAVMVYVGKERDLHSRTQPEIHRTLWHFARRGRTVVRLKGGDPTVFGRGGEELEYLEARGIPVAIVPGVTAASGAAAMLGLPLTHRSHADSVRFVTGHSRSPDEPLTAAAAAQSGASMAAARLSREGRALRRRAGQPEPGPEPEAAPTELTELTELTEGGALAEEPQLLLDFEKLACRRTTLVVYMGLGTLPRLAAGLLAAGLPPDWPAVAVQDATAPGQRVVTAELRGLAEAVAEAGLRSPTLIVIGKVVSLLTPERLAAAAADARARAGARPGEWLAQLQRTPGLSGAGPGGSAGLVRSALLTAPPKQETALPAAAMAAPSPRP